MNADGAITPGMPHTPESVAEPIGVTAAKLTVVWSGVAAGAADWDWAVIAAITASAYSGYLLVRAIVRDAHGIRSWLRRGAGGNGGDRDQ